VRLLIPHFRSTTVLGLASRPACAALGKAALVAVVLVAAIRLPAREKDAVQYGMGLIVNVPFPENEVTQVVEDVVQNGIIRGTKEYNKDEYVSGAAAQSSVRVFPQWSDGGKVFYKVREHAIDPRNFKDGGDVGILAVRYVVQPQGDQNCVLHINALFVEDFRRTAHPSNGSVESAEYKDIHDRLDAIRSMKAQGAEAEREKREQMSPRVANVVAPPMPTPAIQGAPVPGGSDPPPASSPNETAPEPTAQTLEDRVKDLRRQVERLVKAPGAPLKSAPFHTASTLQSLPAGAEVLIVITTAYWLGVETHDGQHGWVERDELELVP
jgi:hypothetical protein